MAARRKARSTAIPDEPVRLEGKIDLAASEGLAGTLKDRRGSDLSIDASGVDQIGAHAVQTLLVARASWIADGKSFRVTGFPDAAVDQLRVLGLSPEALSTEEG